MVRKLSLAGIFILAGSVLSIAEGSNPYSEGFSFEIVAFPGKYYFETYSVYGNETVYLLANRNNIITPKNILFEKNMSLNKLLRRLDILDITEAGTLEISKSGRIYRVVEQENYVVYNNPGFFEYKWGVFRGSKAIEEYRLYLDSLKEYEKKLQIYTAYVESLKEQAALVMMQLIGDERFEEAEKYKKFIENSIEKLPTPQKPAYSLSQPNAGFIINLEKGEYEICFKDRRGNIFEGSEKKLIIFTNIGDAGVGYDVIPEKKWTRGEYNSEPSTVIYVNGSADIYLIPYFQKKFNDEYFSKLTDNQGRGNNNFYRWEKTERVPESRILISRDNGKNYESIKEMPYLVELTEEARLGYNIIPFDEIKYPSRTPSFSAFNIQVLGNKDRIILYASDLNNRQLNNSKREIRSVGSRIPAIFFVVSFLPMFFALLIISRKVRAIRYKDFE